MRFCIVLLAVLQVGLDVRGEDVVIYGATPAGFAAAVEAGRRGVSAVLLEPTGRIGGLTTGGLGQTDSGNTEIYGGISREFYRLVRAHYADPKSWTRQTPDEYHPRGEFKDTWRQGDAMWTFEPSVALRILEDWERREKVRIVRNARLDRGKGGVTVRNGRIASIRTEDGRTWSGKVFIDASYEGDLMAAAGVTYFVGREDNSVYGETLSGCQPTEGFHRLKDGVDPYVVKGDRSSGLLKGIESAPLDGKGAGDTRLQAYCYRMCLTDDPANRIPFAKPEGYDERDYELLFRNYEAKEDRLPWINSPMPNRKTDTNNRCGFSTDLIGGSVRYPEASYAERAEIEKAHLRYQQGLMWTLANHPRIPDWVRKEVSRWGTCRDEFSGERGNGWQNQIYVREARRMVGEYVMTEAECRHIRAAPRPVALGAYNMDSHHVRRYVTAEGSVQNEGDVEVAVTGPYGIDYGALVPKRAECANLLVPVCLSASHIAFGSIRMEPVFFALGQAAGTAASMAASSGCAVQDVDYGRLRTGLLASGQRLPKAESANLALGAKYRLTRAPNYALSKDEGDAVQMTDGKRAGARGYLWTDREAVTWQNCRLPVGISVDLGRTEGISGFSMDFAAGASGVPYPDSINVYTSDDGKLWRYVGDLYAKSRQENGSPRMDGYEKYVARSTRMPTRGRYVQFLVTSGAYFSTSEVEVFAGNAGEPSEANIPEPLEHVKTCRVVQRILRDLERTDPGNGRLRVRVEALVKDAGAPIGKTLLPLNPVHREVWARNSVRLRAAGFGRPVFWTNDRWENLDPLAVPDRGSSGAVALSVEMMRGETRSTAVNVLNPTDGELSCEFTVEGLPDGASVDCREVLFTDTKLFESVSGALRPGEGRRVRFDIPAGASKQVWIAFAKPRLAAGTYVGKIRAAFGGAAPGLTGDIRLSVCDLDFPKRPRVHLCGWDYSVGNCSTYGAPGNAKANQAMMREIHADVFWAPANVRPKGAKFGPDGALLNAGRLDFRLWDEWIGRFPDARRYAVFLNVNSMQTKGEFSFEGEPVGSERFVRMIGDYFRAWRDRARGQGVDPRKVMFLLVDEPAEWQRRYGELPGLIVAWAKAIKAAAPEFVIFEDPDYTGDPRQAGDEMYANCDVLCLQSAKVARPGKNPELGRSFFVPLAGKGKETWLYACSGPSRTHDPVAYYRQLFWLAYQWKAVGCGFWAFGCGGGLGDSWRAYDQPGVEYSPYFVSPTDVMAAKQSEGIREGVEDYEYLKMLEDLVRTARAKGIDTTAAERLLESAPAQALNQTGADGRVKYVFADSREWNVPKERQSVEKARLSVLRELVKLDEIVRKR